MRPERGGIPKRLYEEYAYTLDFLPHGRLGYRAEPTAQLVGESYFTLLEVAIRPNVELKLHERVYVGKGIRDKVYHIKNRLSYDELTPSAKGELAKLVEKIVREHEKTFTDFFNNSSAISPRMHSLELIPGIGKKYVHVILREREKSFFKNFEDIRKRVKIPDPAKLITKRVLEELTTDVKYRLFTRSTQLGKTE